MIQTNIEKPFIFKKLNRKNIYYEGKHMIDSKRWWFQIWIVKTWGTYEIPQKKEISGSHAVRKRVLNVCIYIHFGYFDPCLFLKTSLFQH